MRAMRNVVWKFCQFFKATNKYISVLAVLRMDDYEKC